MSISGLGIIFYSPANLPRLIEGEDYLSRCYTIPEDVLKHVYEGSIVGFGTGSPGNFVLEFRNGCPHAEAVERSDYALRLGVLVKDEKIVFRDLYTLMEWHAECSDEPCINVQNGYYEVTLLSSLPESRVLGDFQSIHIFLNPCARMPQLKFPGVPMLCAF